MLDNLNNSIIKINRIINNNIVALNHKASKLIADIHNDLAGSNNSALIKSIIKYINFKRGKKLRPLLLLLSARAISHRKRTNTQPCIELALAVELIHTASLLHDDVLDNSLERRKQPTINKEFNNKFAILTGDLFYSATFNIIKNIKSPNKNQVINAIIHASKSMVAAEILQLSEKHNFNLSIQQYLKIITDKTAKLFMIAMKLPALLIADRTNEKILGNCGLNFGIAYQLLNDIDDYNKTGNDIIEGKITLPVLLLLKNNSISLKTKKTVTKIISNQHTYNYSQQNKQLAILKNILLKNNSLAMAATIAKKYLTKSKTALKALPESKYKKEILNLIICYENLVLIK